MRAQRTGRRSSCIHKVVPGRPACRARGPAAALAVALAGCSSADAAGGTRLSLVAYSTPQEAYKELIPAFQATAQGKGVTFAESYGASGAQSRAIAAGLTADVAALSLEPDVTKLVYRRSRGQGLERGRRTTATSPIRWSCSWSARATRSTSQGWADLVGAGGEGGDPQPAQLGRSALERDGRLRRPAQGRADPRPGPCVRPASSSGHVVVQDSLGGRLAADLHPRHGRRPSSATRTRRSPRGRTGRTSTGWCRMPTILIENPVAVVEGSANAAAAQAFVAFLRTKPAQQIFAAHGYRPVVAGLTDPGPVPDTGEALHHRRPRRLEGRLEAGSSTRSRGSSWRSSGRWGVGWLSCSRRPSPPVAATARRAPCARARSGRRRPAARSASFSLVVLLPVAALLATGGPGRPPGGSRPHRRRRRRSPSPSWSRSLVTAVDVVTGLLVGVGPGPRRLPGAPRGRRPRRPALRAADDRRRSDPAGAVRADSPLGLDLAYRRPRRRARAALRDAALRGAGPPARARRASTPRWRRRPPASGAGVDDVPADRAAGPAPGPAHRRRARLRPRRSASSGRSCSSRATCRSRPRSPRSFIAGQVENGDPAGAAAVSVVLLARRWSSSSACAAGPAAGGGR